MAPKRKPAKKVTFSNENQVFDIPPKDTVASPTSNEENGMDHVVVQLPISADHVDEILSRDDMCNPLKYNPNLSEPAAYMPLNFFTSRNDEFEGCSGAAPLPANDANEVKSSACPNTKDTCTKHPMCFWCCHPVEHNQFGMPIRYDQHHKNFELFGTFCSLQCSSAYNFSIHMGSDRAWDVQSWIQIMAREYGIPGVVRPAPSRYTLKMFDGPLSIEEFRNAHNSMARTIMVNIPPMVSIRPQVESINTSFMATEGARDQNQTVKKTPIQRRAPTADQRNTLESKMNLSYTPCPVS